MYAPTIVLSDKQSLDLLKDTLKPGKLRNHVFAHAFFDLQPILQKRVSKFKHVFNRGITYAIESLLVYLGIPLI